MDDGRDNHDKNCLESAGHLRDGRNKSPAEVQATERRLSTQTIAQRGLSDGYGNNNTRRRTSGSRNTNGNNNNLIGKKAFEQDFMLSTLKGVANALKSSHRNSLKQSLSSPSYNHHRRPTSAISSASTPPASNSSSSSSSSTASTPNSHLHRHSTPSNNGVDLELVSNCSTLSSASSNLSSSNGGGGGSGVDSGDISGRSSISNTNFNVTMSSDHLSALESMRFDQTSDIESIKKDLIKICRENRLEILAHYVSQIG